MIRLFRRNGEPAGTWLGMTIRPGSRWKVGGQVYVLTDMSVGCDGLRLDYRRLGSWEAARLVDPHAGCWRKPRLPRKRKDGRRGRSL